MQKEGELSINRVEQSKKLEMFNRVQVETIRFQLAYQLTQQPAQQLDLTGQSAIMTKEDLLREFQIAIRKVKIVLYFNCWVDLLRSVTHKR